MRNTEIVSRNKPWGIEEIDELLRMKSDGTPVRKIAKSLNRPLSSVETKLYDFQKADSAEAIIAHARSVEERDRKIASLWGAHTTTDIAAKVQCGRKTVRRVGHRLGLGPALMPPHHRAGRNTEITNTPMLRQKGIDPVNVYWAKNRIKEHPNDPEAILVLGMFREWVRARV